VIIPSRGTPEFWRRYRALPAEVKALARKNYRLFKVKGETILLSAQEQARITLQHGT
jgi:hypothetical protein